MKNAMFPNFSALQLENDRIEAAYIVRFILNQEDLVSRCLSDFYKILDSEVF